MQILFNSHLYTHNCKCKLVTLQQSAMNKMKNIRILITCPPVFNIKITCNSNNCILTYNFLLTLPNCILQNVEK